jgi:hypothetical protein
MKTIVAIHFMSTMLHGANSISGKIGRDGHPPEVIEDTVCPIPLNFDAQPIKETP